MPCGCGGRAKPAVPVTSEDYAMSGLPRFKIVEDGPIDPETGKPTEIILSEHSDYRSASIASRETGGKLRTIKA